MSNIIFVRFEVPSNFLKVAFLGERINAYVYLLDIARFPYENWYFNVILICISPIVR